MAFLRHGNLITGAIKQSMMYPFLAGVRVWYLASTSRYT